MSFARQIGHWLVANAQTIYYLMATTGAFVAVLTYYRNSTIERARWLSSLYSKFYEAPDLKRIRKCLDESSPNAPVITELVRNEDPDFTDYLNFSSSWRIWKTAVSSAAGTSRPCSIITCGCFPNTKKCENMYWKTGTDTAI